MDWDIQQTKKLFNLARVAKEKNKGLSWAFEKMSVDTAKSINSVRNFYYSQLKMFELVPKLKDELGIQTITSDRERFNLFSASEISSLVENILLAKANGMSVRACIAKLSSGNSKLALRLQNKYRSMVKCHKHKVTEIMHNLAARGERFFNPYTKQIQSTTPIDNHIMLQNFVSKLDESEVEGFLSIMQKMFA